MRRVNQPFHLVVPARYGSSRLPGKPLADINGQPMIWHVWKRATNSAAASVVIATDNDEIRSVCTSFGADVEMTAETLKSGTDRVAEVAQRRGWDDDAIVVNVQGDEPLLPSVLIDQAADCLSESLACDAATLCTPLVSVDELFDPDTVKVVRNSKGEALYFSRAPIPWARDAMAKTHAKATDIAELPATVGAGCMRHIGIYAYRIRLLHQFVGWQSSPLEKAEQLEQLRLLENGESVAVAVASETPPQGVDTEADLSRVRRLLAG